MSSVYGNIQMSGRACTKEEHKLALMALQEIEDNKVTVTMTKETPVGDIIQALTKVDVVKIKLDEEVTLRVLRNNRYYLNDTLFGFNATSTEEGHTDKSVNFTGKQLLKNTLTNLLSL